MDELDDIRAFIENEDGSYPKLEDLVARWDSLSPDARSPDLLHRSKREHLIISYMNFSHTKRWAWDGLNQLLITLEDRREPIPNVLKDWAYSVVSRQARGTLKKPNKINRNNPKFAHQDERDMRIKRVMDVLREDGMSREEAIFKIADALNLPKTTVESVVCKMEKFSPFPRPPPR